ncbi:MAG: amidohydrolase family protein [Bacteroidia bacterium]|nr:amidohydrolase family protein [Bacteroidia bacterium]
MNNHRFLSAQYVFTNNGKPLRNGIVEVNENNRIVNVIDTNGEIQEIPRLEFYNGVIVPGFVNAHCHLELSFMKGALTQGTGLQGFVSEFIRKRSVLKSKPEALELADKIMYNNGIVAVGDISNDETSIAVKKNHRIFYHTFCEVFDLLKPSDSIITNANELLKSYTIQGLSASITPHAPYTVSSDLFKQIAGFANNRSAIISVHNQESEAENELFENKTGCLFETLSEMGIDFTDLHSTGRSSLQTYLPLWPKESNILLIHNTFTRKEDIEFATNYSDNIFWVLCPGSNLFIEGSLPDAGMFYLEGCKVAIGTDSLASNDRLSVLAELQILSRHFTYLPFDILLEWATINGAKALHMQHIFGSLENGKTPGINLIENFNFRDMRLTNDSKIKRLV